MIIVPLWTKTGDEEKKDKYLVTTNEMRFVLFSRHHVVDHEPTRREGFGKKKKLRYEHRE